MAKENQGCLAAILKLFGIDLGKFSGDGASREPLPYRQKDNFLSPAEISFFQVLRRVAGDPNHVCAKVRISDLLYVVDRRNNTRHANRIDRKHVDFVICDSRTMQPQLVVELDDSSHKRKDRADRDELVDAAFAAAGLPILHVPAQRSYSPEHLSQQIRSVMRSVSPSSDPAPADSNPDKPCCPKCNIAMVERKAAKGKQTGKRFWACPSYPECREIIPID